jgi:Photosynthetic reaction centre cytochrome C subunit
MTILLIALICIASLAEAQSKTEPKNVHYLTGLSNLDLQRTMNFIRASLGVHCDYCHVVTKESGWEWDKDDKKTKLRARQMIGMVIDINQKHFKGLPVVSCNTCHQGHVKPEGLPSLPQPAPLFPTVVETNDKLPSVANILKKYFDAIGGDQARERLSDCCAVWRKSKLSANAATVIRLWIPYESNLPMFYFWTYRCREWMGLKFWNLFHQRNFPTLFS